MTKLIKNGEVAVLISPGFGAGWSTWNTEFMPDILFDKEIAEALLDGNRDRALEVANTKYPNAYKGGFDSLEVKWLTEGTAFYVDEYDGSESLVTSSDFTLIA